MTIGKKEEALYARIETTFGTFNAPQGSDVLQVANLKFNPAEILRWIDRPIIRASLNDEQGIYGGALMGFEFDMELKGSGTAGTAPRLGRLLRACGLQEAVVSSTSVTYRPLTSIASHEGVSIGYRAGGTYRTARGCRGSFSLKCPAGQPAMLSFKLMGHVQAESDTAAPTASFGETTRPPPFLGASFQIGGYTAAIQELSLDPANNVAVGEDPNSADGYGDVRITARKSGGKVNPEAKLIAVKDYIGIFRANTQQAIATGVIGGTAGNRWAVNVPYAYFKEVPYGDREELLVHEIAFGAAESGSLDDEFTIQFT